MKLSENVRFMAKAVPEITTDYMNDIASSIESMEDIIECVDDYTTVRDQFAMAALQGWLASFGKREGPTSTAAVAEFAYEIADAMLKARET